MKKVLSSLLLTLSLFLINSILFFNTALADVDMICTCKGHVVYASNGQVAGSGSNVNEAMSSALSQCSYMRGGHRLEKCQPMEAVKNPSVMCGCKTGVFERSQVSGQGRNLSEAFESAISSCSDYGLTPDVLNGLHSCRVFPGSPKSL